MSSWVWNQIYAGKSPSDYRRGEKLKDNKTEEIDREIRRLERLKKQIRGN